MNQSELDFFVNEGYVVVENVFSSDEIKAIRDKFHSTLSDIEIDHVAIFEGNNSSSLINCGVRGKSKVANIFYADWKIQTMLDDRVYQLSKSLMDYTFSSSTKSNYTHPFGYSNDVVPYIDLVCYRLPDHIRAEGGLGLHIDANPVDRFKTHRFRPIQSIVALTDHYGGESGGLKVVPKFHKQFDEYFSKSIDAQTEISGEFFRLHSKSYSKLHSMVCPLTVPAGSVVYWDNRLPHQTCEKLTSNDSREVIYFAYLPTIPLNVDYHKKQYEHIKQNIPPPSYCDNKITVDRNWPIDFMEHKFNLLKP